MITPSMTNSGSPLPRIEVVPRIWIWPPPPGAPVFMLMRAPVTLPCSAWSMLIAGTRFKSSALTADTVVAAERLSIDPDCAVTTCVSSWSTSFLSSTATLC